MSKPIGTRVPYAPGTRVWDTTRSASCSYIVVSDGGGKNVEIYDGRNSFGNSVSRDLYAVILTDVRPRRWWLLWLA